MLNVKILSPLILSKVQKNMQTSAQESIAPESTMLRGHTMDLKTLKTNNDKNITKRDLNMPGSEHLMGRWYIYTSIYHERDHKPTPVVHHA